VQVIGDRDEGIAGRRELGQHLTVAWPLKSGAAGAGFGAAGRSLDRAQQRGLEQLCVAR